MATAAAPSMREASHDGAKARWAPQPRPRLPERDSEAIHGWPCTSAETLWRQLKLGQCDAHIFSQLSSPLNLAYQVLHAFLVLQALDAGEADAPKFQWCIDDSLLHFPADAQCGKDGVLEDYGYPLALRGREGGEGERVRNDRVDPGL